MSEATALTVENFRKMREFVLQRGDRQTYCNMYNHNPHYAFVTADVFLNPDVGQRNIDCDPTLSGFDEIVVRLHGEGGGRYITLREAAGALVTQGASPAEAARAFEKLLADVRRAFNESAGRRGK